MAEATRQALKDCGVNPERYALDWTSAAEAPRFVELITNFVRKIKGLGPIGMAEGEPGKGPLERHLDAGVKAFESVKVRTAYGSLARNLHKGGDYSSEVISDGVGSKVSPGFREERLGQEVRQRIGEDGPSDVETLCEKTGGSREEIEKVLAALSKKGQVKGEGAVWTAV